MRGALGYLRHRHPILCSAIFILAILSCAATARERQPRSASEFAVHNRAGLADVEIELSDAGTANGLRQPVTDMVLFASRRGMEIGKLLAAADGALPQDEGGVPSRSLFTVRLFVVAGGRLYTGIKGQCSVWANNVSRCTTSCDGGTFAVRRRGSAPLELLLGAVPGGDAGEAGGLDTTGCAIEEGASARLVPKAGRGLAVIGFGTE